MIPYMKRETRIRRRGRQHRALFEGAVHYRDPEDRAKFGPRTNKPLIFGRNKTYISVLSLYFSIVRKY